MVHQPFPVANKEEQLENIVFPEWCSSEVDNDHLFINSNFFNHVAAVLLDVLFASEKFF